MTLKNTKESPKSVFHIKQKDVENPTPTNASEQPIVYIVDRFEKNGELVYDSHQPEGQRIVNQKIWDECKIEWGLRKKGTSKIYTCDKEQVTKENKAEFTLPKTMPSGFPVEELNLQKISGIEISAQLILPDGTSIVNDKTDENLLPDEIAQKLIGETLKAESKKDVEKGPKSKTRTKTSSSKGSGGEATDKGGDKGPKSKTRTKTSSSKGSGGEATDKGGDKGPKSKTRTKTSSSKGSGGEATDKGGDKGQKSKTQTKTSSSEESGGEATGTQISSTDMQALIDEEADSPTVKIIVKNDDLKLGQSPDIKFTEGPSELKFEFVEASPINYEKGKCKSKITYEVYSKVDGTTPKQVKEREVTFPKAYENTLKSKFKETFTQYYEKKNQVLSLGQKAEEQGDDVLYALSFGKIDSLKVNKYRDRHLYLKTKLWESEVNGQFKKMTDLEHKLKHKFSISLGIENPEKLVLCVKDIDKIDGLKSFFTDKTYRVEKIDNKVTFTSTEGGKKLSAFIAPRSRPVTVNDLKGKTFRAEEVCEELHSTGEGYYNYRLLEFLDDGKHAKWKMSYKSENTSNNEITVSQEMDWTFSPASSSSGASVTLTTPDTPVISKNGSKINVKKSDDGLEVPDYPWIKNYGQFTLDALVKWSPDQEGKFILEVNPKASAPKQESDPMGFWFYKDFKKGHTEDSGVVTLEKYSESK